MLPVSVVLIVAYLLYIGMFLTGISNKARELYTDSGLPFWKLAVASSNRAVLATIVVTSTVLFSRWPGPASIWVDAIFAVVLPLLAVFVLYASWYLIVGRQNKQIKFDARKERAFIA